MGKPEQSTRYKHNGVGMWTARCSCGYQTSYYLEKGQAERNSFYHANRAGKKDK